MCEYKILTGNEAITHGALAAGLTFFAGYPITPATEIAELSSELLPKTGGTYMQMEDELASIAAVLGASFAGGKAMTATSGPGFSLMQENIGYGMLAEVPCVVVDVMRQGPCQGVATVPAQGDIMQARWGTQGDHPAVVLAPNSVSEAYYETIRAFNLAEKYRTPVFILSDATLAHMSEKVCIPDPEELTIINRKKPTCSPKDYLPYEDYGTDIAPMASFGDGYRWYVSGIIHDASGFPVTNKPSVIEDKLSHLRRKIENNISDIQKWEEYRTEDAEIIVISIGLVSRCVKQVIETLRAEGVKIGLFRPVTLWPFPEKRLEELARQADKLITCEMNDGQLYQIVRGVAGRDTAVYAVTQNDGTLIRADTVQKRIREVL